MERVSVDVPGQQPVARHRGLRRYGRRTQADDEGQIPEHDNLPFSPLVSAI